MDKGLTADFSVKSTAVRWLLGSLLDTEVELHPCSYEEFRHSNIKISHFYSLRVYYILGPLSHFVPSETFD